MAKRTTKSTSKSTGARHAQRLRRTAEKSLSVVRKSQESADASMQVISKRVALGLAALTDPLAADHEEFGRMIPEKIGALSTTGLIFGEKSALLGFRLLRQMNEETIRAATHLRNAMEMRDPVAALTAQMSYVTAASQRLFAASLAFASSGATMLDAASTPLHRTVMANAKRLR